MRLPACPPACIPADLPDLSPLPIARSQPQSEDKKAVDELAGEVEAKATVEDKTE